MNAFKILSGSNILLYSCDFGDGIAIGFNDGRHFIVMGAGDYAVYPFHSPMVRINCELIPCKREDLKLNDTAYCTSAKVPNPDNLSDYCKILDEYTILYVGSDNLLHESKADLSHFDWYEVVPINK